MPRRVSKLDIILFVCSFVVRVCVCLRLHLHTLASTRMYTCIHSHRLECTLVYTRIDSNVHLHTLASTRMYTCIHSHRLECTLACTYRKFGFPKHEAIPPLRPFRLFDSSFESSWRLKSHRTSLNLQIGAVLEILAS